MKKIKLGKTKPGMIVQDIAEAGGGLFEVVSVDQDNNNADLKPLNKFKTIYYLSIDGLYPFPLDSEWYIHKGLASVNVNRIFKQPIKTK